jgi:hypothetical protein
MKRFVVVIVIVIIIIIIIIIIIDVFGNVLFCYNQPLTKMSTTTCFREVKRGLCVSLTTSQPPMSQLWDSRHLTTL